MILAIECDRDKPILASPICGLQKDAQYNKKMVDRYINRVILI